MILVALLLIASQSHAFVLTGQSLSTGGNTVSAISTAQTHGNTIWTGNLNSSIADAPTEGTTPSLTAEMVEESLESPRSGIANCYEHLTGTPLLGMANGQGGYAYSQLAEGTERWGILVNMMEAYGARIRGGVLGMVIIHGENDRTSASYYDDLLEWAASFRALAARVGVGQSLPVYISQMSSCTYYSLSSLGTCTSPLFQYQVARDEGLVLVGPKYQYEYATDGLHLTNTSSRLLGEQIGRAMAWGPTWTGVRPRAVSANGAVISVQMYVPAPPLVIDTTLVSDPGNYGFTYADDDSPPAVSSVALSGDDTVVLTLASTPTGGNRRIRYAYTGTSGNDAGPTTGMRGNIRDSDTTTCGSGTMLRNWLVHFEEAVP